jgi:HK97 family phage portal protein
MDTFLTVNTVTPGTLHRPPEVKSTITAQMLGLDRSQDAPITSIALAYQMVPWFRRACKLRANGLGSFPLALYPLTAGGEENHETDVSEKPEYQAVMQWTRSLLYRTEMNLVKYGAAYHLLETNRFGLNHTPRFIPTNSVMVQANYVDGVTGFHISGIGTFAVKSGRVVWAWEPNDESEIAPGPSDGYAALKASGLLYAIQEMANRYMVSGAVPITAVMVPAAVDPSEHVKIEGALARIATGFRNAFKFLVFKRDTEFVKVGSEMKDIMAPELTDTERDNVAVAMRVPPTVIDGKSANYATAESEMVGFYMNTVIPQASMLEPLLNTQLYQRLGLTLRFKPDELEVMQSIQLLQSQGVTELVGKPILSIDEGRAIIEMEPVPDGLGEWKEPEPPMVVAPDGKPVPGQAKPAPEDEDAPAKMKAWLDTSLAQVKSGQPATVGAPFDDELAAASSGKMVRRIYETHWPRVSAPPDDPQLRAVLALEEFNALARRSVPNG